MKLYFRDRKSVEGMLGWNTDRRMRFPKESKCMMMWRMEVVDDDKIDMNGVVKHN